MIECVTNKLVIGVVLMASFLSAATGRGATVGEVVKDFTVPNQDGIQVTLSSYKGKPVLLYFYPKDDTPGCTKEAQNFRDEFPKFEKMNAVIFGVSRQDPKSHKEFKQKYQLPFDLLVDADGSLAKQLGISQMPIIGLHKRQSVLIGPDGRVAKFYDDVDPKTHSQEVAQDIQKLTK
jgi:peroxiredoxin Q/BCP